MIKAKKIHYKWIHRTDGYTVRIAMQDSFTTGRSIVFYPSGAIATIDHWHKNIRVGRSYSFFKNGKVKEIYSYQNGKKTGRVFEFYQSGNLRYRLNLIDGQHSGYHEEFYDSLIPRLHKCVSYSIVKGKEWQNGYIEYDIHGNIINCHQWLHYTFDKKILS